MSLKDSVQDSFAETFLALNHSKGATFANQRAREIVNTGWEQDPLSRISGKLALSRLSDWSKQKFAVSFGITTLLQEMKRAEVDVEIVDVLTAIEELSEFVVAGEPTKP